MNTKFKHLCRNMHLSPSPSNSHKTQLIRLNLKLYHNQTNKPVSIWLERCMQYTTQKDEKFNT